MSSNVTDITGKIIVAAQIKAKPGKGDVVAQKIAECRDHALSDKEPGTITYRIARFGEEFTVFEEYADAAAFGEHVKGPIAQVAAQKDEYLEVLAWKFFSEY